MPLIWSVLSLPHLSGWPIGDRGRAFYILETFYVLCLSRLNFATLVYRKIGATEACAMYVFIKHTYCGVSA